MHTIHKSIDNSIPCVRHGVAGTADARLIELLSTARAAAGSDPIPHLRALNLYPGQLWATWTDDASRERFAPILDHAWRSLGESVPCVHLVPSDDAYDYQEEVMNNADAD